MRLTWETMLAGDFARDYTVPLIFEDGRWAIVWNDGLILPELAGGNRLTMEIRAPSRAAIYDRDGQPLAYQGTIVSLGVVPGQIEDEEGLLEALSPLLGLTPEEIQAIYAPSQPDWYWPIGDVRQEVMQEQSGLLDYVDRGLAPPRERQARLYAPDGTAAHIIGYTGFIPAEEVDAYRASGYRGDEQVGRAGLEAWAEDTLNGEAGGILQVVRPDGAFVSVVNEKEPQEGEALTLTIDLNFQRAVEQALSEAITTHPEGSAGSIVVLDVHTGAVRALASFPTYNPAVFDAARPDAGAALADVLGDPGRPLFNRATQAAYPAGSLFKIITMAAALNSEIYTPDTRYNSTGAWTRLGEGLTKYDWLEGGHGNITLRDALVVSCNSCFYEVGYNLYELDPNLVSASAREFGLGAPTGIQLGESSGLIPNEEWKLATYGEGWSAADAVNMAIGQGFVQVTPLQIATVLAAVANGGALVTPTLVESIGQGAGQALQGQVRGQLPLSPENLRVIQDSLFAVANDLELGTAAERFDGLPVPVSGKTGTAEDPPREPHSWFAGYAAPPPAASGEATLDSPEVAVVVMVENAGEGSAVAAPIFRRIIELYYDVTPHAPFPWP